MMRFFLILCLWFFSGNTAYADGFSSDSSKPVPETPAAPVQADNKPVTPKSKSAWRQYDAPIRQCIQGDTILPSANNKILDYLFNNVADTNALMAIAGKKAGRCVVTFSEGSMVKTCHFTPKTLALLMENLVTPSQFDPASVLAQGLGEECQSG